MTKHIDWTNTSCYLCGWTADRGTSRSIKDVVERYGEVANLVNERELKRFASEIKARWKPVPPAEYYWDEGYRGEGWTEEGAFAMCVFENAMGPFMKFQPKREGPLCEAEEMNQVLFRSMDALLDDIRYGPLYDPQPEDKISEALASLRASLQREVDANVQSPENISVELPNDFKELVRVTDGVSGAGIPSETADTHLVDSIRGLQAMPGFTKIYTREHWTPFAAWQLGGCTQHRQIYYVLCRDAHDDTAPIAWKVFDRNDIDLNVYDSLTEFLEHETLHIELRPGGHVQEDVLCYEEYPSNRWWDMNGGSWKLPQSTD